MTDDYDMIPFNGTLIAASAKAWLVKIDQTEEWLPKSQCELDEPDTPRGDPCSGTIPRWLVKKKNLMESCEASLRETSSSGQTGEDVPNYPHLDPELDDEIPF